MNNVVQFPANDLDSLIQAVERVDFDAIAPLLMFALERGLSTKPIVELIGQCAPAECANAQELDLATKTFVELLGQRAVGQELGPFVGWCNSCSFKLGVEAIQEPPVVEESADPAREAIFEIASPDYAPLVGGCSASY